jgi:hypothetical protein
MDHGTKGLRSRKLLDKECAETSNTSMVLHQYQAQETPG